MVSSAGRGVYAAGQLLWTIEDRLVAQAFVPASGSLEGESRTLVPAVYQGAGRTPAFWASDSALLYAVAGSRERQFRWFDRVGTALQTAGPPGLYGGFDLSPDGSRVVIEVLKDGPAVRSTISSLDTSSGVFTLITSGDLNDNDPRFGPGGEIAFARNTSDPPGIVRVDSTGAQSHGAPAARQAPGRLAGGLGRHWRVTRLSFVRGPGRVGVATRVAGTQAPYPGDRAN